MILFPAIDIKDGKCVRLKQGDINQATVFNENPADQAKQFAAQGVSWIHIVDLNGAFDGAPSNEDEVAEIIDAVPDIKLQLGGGVRNLGTVAAWLEVGIERLVLGTAAVKDPEFVFEACKQFPGKIAVSIDAREDKVAVNGWAEQSATSVQDLVLKFEDAGIAALIYTDIIKDGMMQGPNIEAIKKLGSITKIPIIASGGVSSMDDINAIKELGIEGVICGRSVYEGKIDVAEAVNSLELMRKTG